MINGGALASTQNELDRILEEFEEVTRIGKELTDKNNFTKEDSRKLLDEVRRKYNCSRY